MRCPTCKAEGVVRIETHINPDSGLHDGHESECETCVGSGVVCNDCGVPLTKDNRCFAAGGPDVCVKCGETARQMGPPAEVWS